MRRLRSAQLMGTDSAVSLYGRILMRSQLLHPAPLVGRRLSRALSDDRTAPDRRRRKTAYASCRRSRKACAIRNRLAISVLVSLVVLTGCEEPTRPELDEVSISSRQARLTSNRYIVVFTDDVTDPPGMAHRMARAQGIELRHTYSTAVKGFAAVVPPGRVDALEAQSQVRYVAADRVHELYQQQELPSGVDRIEADLNLSSAASDPVDVDIAILDSGIDLDHPDLNVYRAVSFAGGKGDDGLGHGTHVAGTAAAKDNGTGVVGVAPGARLWAVKVCKNSGTCFESDIIAGIDFVAQNAGEIEVANMSLGGRGSDDGDCGRTLGDPEHEAICGAVETGVTFVVSAGNSGADAANYVPASYDEVITVSALADFDGQPGGKGAPSCRSDEDDSFADFSNYGADVDVMAPGVCIESTWKQGETSTISGTSMAAPHVTGTVALYVASHGRDANGDGTVDGADADFVRAAVVEAGIAQLGTCGLSTFDDPDGIAEPLVFANASNVGGDGSCLTPPPSGGDVAISDVRASPSIATPGDPIDVRVTVENVGQVDVSGDISVFLVSDNTTLSDADDIPIGTETINGGLTAGQSEELVFTWNSVGANSGDHTLTARHGLSDDDETNDSGTVIVTMEDGALPTIHVGNLDRASTKGDRGGTWKAWVRISTHDVDHASLEGAEVTGHWDAGATGQAVCTTLSSGTCEVSSSSIPNRQGNVTFTVDDVNIDGLAYDSANHDPDGNSDGTTIRVFLSNNDDYMA